MRQLSLFWKLYLSYLLVIVLALLMVIIGSYAVGVFRESFLAQPDHRCRPGSRRQCYGAFGGRPHRLLAPQTWHHW